MHRVKNLTGKVFGRLTVLEFVRTDVIILGNDPPRKQCIDYWRCRCQCGALWVARADNLEHGTCRSCGCLRLEQNKRNAPRLARMITRSNRKFWAGHKRAKKKESAADPEFEAAMRAALAHKCGKLT